MLHGESFFSSIFASLARGGTAKRGEILIILEPFPNTDAIEKGQPHTKIEETSMANARVNHHFQVKFGFNQRYL